MVSTSVRSGTPSFGERYRVERELGRGGMATVYLCTDTKFDRPVAIKLLHPDLAAAVGAERFHREIKIATGLTHPNILPAHDSGEADGSLYYVMPFVEGESLRDRLVRERQLSVEEAVRITCEIASALHYAHTRGIIHRDIKPENILLQSEHAVVADFGIARAVSSAGEAEALTQTGMSLGTPAYMSPEQAMGEKTIDGRSDQYSLACVAYEMLAGQPPFTAPTFQALVARHLAEAAPLISTVRPSVPDELEDVILRALEKVPADRFASLAEFADALSAVIATTGTWTRRTTSRSSVAIRQTRSNRAVPQAFPRRWRFAAAGAVVLALVGVSLGVWRVRQQPALAAFGDLDPSRIAVLYFDDVSRNADLRHVADGLTESLIEQLSDVSALSVVSRNGVAPFRGTTVGADSIGRALKAGSIVRGALELIPRGTRVDIRLVDAGSGVDIARKRFEYDTTQVLAMQGEIAAEVAAFLRQRLGPEVRLREQRRATSSAEAWMLVQRAERRHKDADSLRMAGARQSALLALAVADSLLGRAELADREWATPVAARASVAYTLAQTLRRERAPLQTAVDSGLSHADRALARDQRNADALEYKGKLLYMRVTEHLVDPTQVDRTLAVAESTLTRAVTINRTQAGAWDALSALHYRKPDLQAVIHAAQRAYESDSYMRSAHPILIRLFLASYNLEHYPEAMRWLGIFRDRFPDDRYFAENRLFMYWTKHSTPDVDSAWKYAELFVERTPERDRPLARKRADMLVAGVLANVQLPDSARRVLLRARAPVQLDPRRDLSAAEAAVRVKLGDHDLAVDLIKEYLAVNPEHRRGFANRTYWMWRDLQDNPKFKILIAGL